MKCQENTALQRHKSIGRIAVFSIQQVDNDRLSAKDCTYVGHKIPKTYYPLYDKRKAAGGRFPLFRIPFFSPQILNR